MSEVQPSPPPRSPCRVGVWVFFFQAEDGIRDLTVTGVQTCALPISVQNQVRVEFADDANVKALHRAVSFFMTRSTRTLGSKRETSSFLMRAGSGARQLAAPQEIGRAHV